VKPTGNAEYQAGFMDGVHTERRRVAAIVEYLISSEARLYILNNGLNKLEVLIKNALKKIREGRG
jgi:hypothetical protein